MKNDRLVLNIKKVFPVTKKTLEKQKVLTFSLKYYIFTDILGSFLDKVMDFVLCVNAILNTHESFALKIMSFFTLFFNQTL